MKDARILCVDDEPAVLEGLGRVLHRKCIVLTATSGAGALRLLAKEESIDVIVSDMRMPEMNGATLLTECRKRHPVTVRMLLTGHSDLDSATQAVNEGQVFRFLTKPCPPPLFLEALAQAVEKHRLELKERVMFEQSVVGSVCALTEVIALVHPGTLAATSRQLERARKAASYLHVADPWHVEVAAILAQAGYTVLPNDLLARASTPSPGRPNEPGMMARLPLVLARVLSGIPRLDYAQAALKFQHRPFLCDDGGPEKEALPIGSRILKVLADLAAEESRIPGTTRALSVLRSQTGRYDPSVLEAVTATCMPRSLAPQAAEQGVSSARK
ncbi:MAG: response regulator [Polyangiaceae bacterium]